MNHQGVKRLLLLIGIVITAATFAVPAVQAQEPAKTTKEKAAKSKKAAKKNDQASAKGACDAGGKKWREGEHCMVGCNDKATLCDMQICKEGAWKPYSSCFGKGAVSPNCPAACS